MAATFRKSWDPNRLNPTRGLETEPLSHYSYTRNPYTRMPDSLYLSLWFHSFSEREMLPRLLAVVHQFPASQARPGIGRVAVHPVSWDEPLIYEQTFDFRTDAEHALALAGDFLHDDYAYEIEAAWDLWVMDDVASVADDVTSPAGASEEHEWLLTPQPVRFVAHGPKFDGGSFQQFGHIQVDLGLDAPFLHEEVTFDQAAEARVRQNIQKLVGFTTAVEKNCGISGRVLWSESDENLAQKLISRLQRVH